MSLDQHAAIPVDTHVFQVHKSTVADPERFFPDPTFRVVPDPDSIIKLEPSINITDFTYHSPSKTMFKASPIKYVCTVIKDEFEHF